MIQPVTSRLQREKKFWKFLALAQLFLLLLMVLHAQKFSNSSTNQEGRNSSDTSKSSVIVEAPLLTTTTGRVSQSPPSKRLFNSESLQWIQSQSDINLVQNIQENWLKSPSKLDYNITPDTTADLWAVRKLHTFIVEQFDGKRNGFFIECGAFDGVALSNTLHLEQDYNWTGLLVEADPHFFTRLIQKNRKSWTINACLAIKPFEQKVRMTRMKNSDALSVISEFADSNFRQSPQAEEFEAQCFPLTSILAALGQTMNIDYLSLDVEGAELKILYTVPWDFVYIKVISVEANEERIGPIIEFLTSRNYQHLKHIKGPWITDHVFGHTQFLEDRSATL